MRLVGCHLLLPGTIHAPLTRFLRKMFCRIWNVFFARSMSLLFAVPGFVCLGTRHKCSEISSSKTDLQQLTGDRSGEGPQVFNIFQRQQGWKPPSLGNEMLRSGFNLDNLSINYPWPEVGPNTGPLQPNAGITYVELGRHVVHLVMLG